MTRIPSGSVVSSMAGSGPASWRTAPRAPPFGEDTASVAPAAPAASTGAAPAPTARAAAAAAVAAAAALAAGRGAPAHGLGTEVAELVADLGVEAVLERHILAVAAS